MATAVVYVDEAGSPEMHRVPTRDGETPLLTLAGLAFPLRGWRERDREYLRLKRQFFPDMMGRAGNRDEEIEVKGRDLTSPRHRTSGRRQAFNRHALDLAHRCGGTAFAATFLKNPAQPTPGHSLYAKALQILVERISVFIAESDVYDSAILICDSRMKGIAGKDLEVARSHMSFIFGHVTGRTFTNILEAPLFADSRLMVGLQLADIVAANLYASQYDYHLRSAPGALDYSHARACWPRLDRLQFKSTGQVDGFTLYGYRTVDLRR